jgi:long-subunit acyl-CoA synthetase (AMP-forming)
MMGYYKKPELTKNAFTLEGFFKTGDRGELDSAGRLKITGRTSKGKYVAPAPIENKLLTSDKIEIACVSGSGQSAPFAMVVLSELVRGEAKNESNRAKLAQALDKYP